MPGDGGSANGGVPSAGPSSPSSSTASLAVNGPPPAGKSSLMRTLGSRVFRGKSEQLGTDSRRDSISLESNGDRKMSVSSFPGQTISGVPPKVNGVSPAFNAATVGVKPSPLKPVQNDDLPPSLKTGLMNTWSPSSTQLEKLKDVVSASTLSGPVQRPNRFPDYPGYRIVKKLDETVNCTVYRAVRHGDSSNKPVILKVSGLFDNR